MVRFALLAWLVAATASLAADARPAAFDRVEIAPTRTSIYVGTVSMSLPVLVRQNGAYSATYRARVFPYFFYNETGRLSIVVTDEALQRLARGETIEFEGEGVSASGDRRRVAGRAIPASGRSGKIKVRVFVSPRVQLIFNTTYRFVD